MIRKTIFILMFFFNLESHCFSIFALSKIIKTFCYSAIKKGAYYKKRFAAVTGFIFFSSLFLKYSTIEKIYGLTMYPRISNKSILYPSINKQLNHGDLIVYKEIETLNSSTYMGRIIALPGDEIKGELDKEGYPLVYLNGNKLNEDYINTKISFRKYLDKRTLKYGIEPTYVKKDLTNENCYYIGKVFDGKYHSKNVFKHFLSKDQLWVLNDNRIIHCNNYSRCKDCDSRCKGSIGINQIINKLTSNPPFEQIKKEILPDIKKDINNLRSDDFSKFPVT
jgi:signal peptidase I